jgi:hypothetical protein
LSESAIAFGQFNHLLGVWNEPEERRYNTAVIFVTAGMLHHCGPFRLHVDAARELASQGIPSLRFDLSGIGESLAVGSQGTSLDRAASEIREAIDWIGNATDKSCNGKIGKVILFGLCSGADDSLHAAPLDERIVGLIAIDGCGYRTPGYYLRRVFKFYLPRVLSLAKWKGLWHRHRQLKTAVPRSLQPGYDVREFPSRRKAQQIFKVLLQRDVHLHFIYTGGSESGQYYNYDGQFKAMFPRMHRDPRLTHRYLADMDHVAFLCEDRARLVSHITQIAARFAEANE